MKSILVFLLFAFFSIMDLSAQGSIDCGQSIKSDILKRDMAYSVYLPPSYKTSNRSYPVLYLLHGMTGDANDWVLKGEAGQIADKAIAEGKSPEMIIVMPDGLFDAFYINNYDKSIMWEDFFHKEFIPQIEKKYRIVANRNNRAIAGLSMGGYGSLYHAVHYKDKFMFCYAMSAAVLERQALKPGEKLSDWDAGLTTKLMGPIDAEGYPETYKKHSIHEFFRMGEEYKAPTFNWLTGKGDVGLPMLFIDCGDDDFLIENNMSLIKILRQKKVPHQLRVYDGGHTWEYWRTALANAMAEIGGAIRKY